MPKIKGYIYNWDEVPLIIDLPYAARLLGCSVQLIRKNCQDGKIPAFKIGAMWRIRKEDMIAYTKERYADNTAI